MTSSHAKTLGTLSGVPAPAIVVGKYDYKDAGAYVDFANKQLGGAFLSHGLAQEEIMLHEFTGVGLATAFSIAQGQNCVLLDREVAVMTGCIRYFEIGFYGQSKSPVATENLLENTDGGRGAGGVEAPPSVFSRPSVFPRDGSLLPSS